MNEKTCTKCNQTFPATKEYFHIQKRAKCGLRSACKKCRSKSCRAYREANKKLIADRRHEYRKANKEKIANYKREYYEMNKEEIVEYMREYYEANKEQMAEKNREWQKANPDKLRIIDSRRRARKRALPDTFTPEQWNYCLEYFNYICPACDNQLRDLFGNVEPHADHWIPLSYEGDDNPGTVATNMVCLCNSCNLSKRAKMPDEWLKDTYGTRKANEILARIEAYFDHVSDDDLQAKSA